MSQPAVRQTETDGALGVLPPSTGQLLAVVGVSSAGPLDTVATYGRVPSLVADFGSGPLVEAAARHIETTGDPVAVVRTGQTTAGTEGAVVKTGTGTSVVTVDPASAPLDDYELYLLVIAGGTIGVAGITLQWSLDGGRTLSPVTALGVANEFAVPGSGVTIDFGVGTLVAGDTIACRTTAPAPNGTELGAALTALKNSAVSWELCHITAPIDATLFDVVETQFAGMFAAKKYRAWVGSVRMPDVGETEAAYLTALSTAFAAKSTKVGELCAGACKLISSAVSGRKYRRPISFAIASLEARVQQHINIADIKLGAIVGCSIRDDNGNPDEHDESINPGLDDARFTVLRTWEGRSGVYVNRPRIFSSAGSDYDLMVKRRVMNLARRTTREYLELRLSEPIRVNAVTGFILEEEAVEIESGGNAALAAVLGSAPKASGWAMVLARNDNLLSTKTLTVTTRIVPLAYVEFIEESIAFLNPALQVQAA